MAFLLTLIITTFCIAGSAALFSVYGLAHTFSGAFWSVVFMGASLEAGKLISVSFLYRYWKTAAWTLKAYLMSAVFMLMVITSVGIFAFLSAAYQTDTLEYKGVETQLNSLRTEKEELTKRKVEIDVQIAQIPADYVTAKQRLMRTFKSELDHINVRLPQITAELQKEQQRQIQVQAHTGPITYIASAFGSSVDDATKWIILMLIIVFDPLAVALTLAINMVILTRDPNGVRFSQVLPQTLQPSTVTTTTEATKEAEVKVPSLKVPSPQLPSTTFSWTQNPPTWLSMGKTKLTPPTKEPSPKGVEADKVLADLDTFLDNLEKATVKVSAPEPKPVEVSPKIDELPPPLEPEPSVEGEPEPTISTVEQLKETYSEPEPIVLSEEDLATAEKLSPQPQTINIARPAVRRLFSGPVAPEDDHPKK